MTRLRKAAQCLAILILPVIMTVSGPSAVLAQEHPEGKEHPKGKEHPSGSEHPEDAAVKVDVELMAKAITDYVGNDTKLKGGYFFVFDPATKSPLALTLTLVHKERLSQVGENLFFACSDFDERGGKVYDLDFFMMVMGDKLMVTEVMIHKEDGKPRYTWFEEDGIWKRK